MAGLFPTQEALRNAFAPNTAWARRSPDRVVRKTSIRDQASVFSVWSAADDAKNKAVQVGDKIAAEYNKASEVAKANTGGIELYSAKYYAACTFGGILACVRCNWSCVV